MNKTRTRTLVRPFTLSPTNSIETWIYRVWPETETVLFSVSQAYTLDQFMVANGRDATHWCWNNIHNNNTINNTDIVVRIGRDPIYKSFALAVVCVDVVVVPLLARSSAASGPLSLSPHLISSSTTSTCQSVLFHVLLLVVVVVVALLLQLVQL